VSPDITAHPETTAHSDITTLGKHVVDALRATPRGVGARKVLRVDAMPLGDGVARTLILEEKSVLASDFRIEVESVNANGEIVRRVQSAPTMRCYGGIVDGVAGSDVWIAVWDDPDALRRGSTEGASRDHSFMYGMVRFADGMRVIASPPAKAARRAELPVVLFDPAKHPHEMSINPESFCEAFSHGVLGVSQASSSVDSAAGDGGVAGATTCRELSVAIDTDTAFTRDLFDHDHNAAAAYAIALVSAVSEIAERDVATRYKLRYLRLRDPVTSFVPPLTVFALMGDWNASMRHVPRDFVHSFSGGPVGAGEAYLGALCSESVFGSDFAYGASRGLTGSFPYPLTDFTEGFFDVFLVGHEIGHTLGAPHTFESSPSFETCGYLNCASGATGSLMSYCVLCPGGTANITLRYHPISVGYMEAKFAELPCTYTGSDAPIARDDSVRSMGLAPVDAAVLLNDRGTACSEVELAWFAPKTARGCTVESFVGVDGRAALRVMPLLGIAGADSVEYGVVDSGGASAMATLSIEWMPPMRATNVVGALPGIGVAAYDTTEISSLPDFDALTPFLVTTVSRPSFVASATQVVPPTNRLDRVAQRYDGWLTVPETDVWRFAVTSDAGSRLWIDEVLVVDHDGVHGATRKDGFAGLSVGPHRIRLEYFEDTGAACINLRWSRSGVSEVDIAASWYSRGGVVPQPDIDGSGAVDYIDLTRLIGAWGSCDGCPEDLDQNGVVESTDLSLLIDAWGPVE